MPVRVKICGITSVADARLACDAGADAIGFVFWPKSPRNVEIETAAAIAREAAPFVVRVGVFVDASADRLRTTAEAVGLDLLQLHGAELPEMFGDLARRAVKAVRVGPGFVADEALRFEGKASGILLDTQSQTAAGGTGQTFDWSLARSVREGARYLILAGGLTPENVADAVRAVQPDAVDVSSGVESSPGKKDEAKVRAFLQAVRSA